MTNKKNIKQNVSNIKLCPRCQEKKLIKDKVLMKVIINHQ